MKKIFNILSVVAAMVTLASCETYKVDAPDMTAISNIDGKYIAFAYENGSSTPSTVLGIVITNTTDNSSTKAWMTISDMNPAIYSSTTYLDAIRFSIAVDVNAQTIKASSVSATEPNTCWNPYLEGWYGSYGGYYTKAYRTKNFKNYTVSIDGTIKTDGIKTKQSTADAIEFSYSRTYPDGTTVNYTVKGMKKTGWEEDAQEYEDFVNENFLN